MRAILVDVMPLLAMVLMVKADRTQVKRSASTSQDSITVVVGLLICMMPLPRHGSRGEVREKLDKKVGVNITGKCYSSGRVINWRAAPSSPWFSCLRPIGPGTK